LRGTLLVAPDAASVGQPAPGVPAPGTAWVDAALLVALNLQIGQPLLLGDATFTLAQVIVTEPDRGGGFFDVCTTCHGQRS
jgi:putative ABC transport system permease protein